MFFRDILNQRKTGKSWGYMVQVASQTSILVAILNLLLISVTAYNTTLSPWMQEQGILIPFWAFMFTLSVFVLVIAIVLYKFAVPSYFSAFNDQFYKHDNLLRQDIEKIKKALGIEDETSDSSGH